MPHLKIETNLPRSKIPKDFFEKATKVFAKTLDRAEELTLISVTPDVLMTFGATDAPAAVATVMSIGRQGVEENKKHSKLLFDLVEKELGVPSDRMFITFQDEPSSNVGFKGTTIHELWS